MHTKDIELLNDNHKHLHPMFMIHPGGGDAMVYSNIAQQINDKYNCYAVNNYNMLHTKKINSVRKLAETYLEYIDERLIKDNISFFGWSLGGQIAIEMAQILEEKGVKNITVWLMDTILIKSFIIRTFISIFCVVMKKEIMRQYILYLQNCGYSGEYIDRVVDAYNAERKLTTQFPTKKLKSSKVILLRGILHNPDVYYDKYLCKYKMKSKANNLTEYCENIKVVDLNCGHHTIIKYPGVIDALRNNN